MLAQRKFVELMFDDDAVAPDHKARTMGLIEQFKREIVSIESRLSHSVTLTRLRGQPVVNEDGSQVTANNPNNVKALEWVVNRWAKIGPEKIAAWNASLAGRGERSAGRWRCGLAWRAAHG